MNQKPFLIIRRRGYYVNIIQNLPEARQVWMQHNLPRTDLRCKPDKDGLYPEKSLLSLLKASSLSFIPATAEEAFNARLFDPAMKHRCGLIR